MLLVLCVILYLVGCTIEEGCEKIADAIRDRKDEPPI